MSASVFMDITRLYMELYILNGRGIALPPVDGCDSIANEEKDSFSYMSYARYGASAYQHSEGLYIYIYVCVCVHTLKGSGGALALFTKQNEV